MKTKQIISIAVASVLPLAAFAQTSPVPPAPPQTPLPPAPAAPAAPGAPDRHHDKITKEPVTFLGVETSSVPSVVSEQLGLAKGFGLVVDYVVKDGPAEQAGLLKNDILKMLNDQILLEPDQLGKLIRSYPEGTSVTMTVLRKGQESKITVRLGKKEVSRRRDFGHFGHGLEGLEKLGKLEKLGELKELGKLGDPETWNGFSFSFDGEDGEDGEEGEDGEDGDENVLRVRETVERAREAADRAREDAARVREQAQEVREKARERRDEARQQREEMRTRGTVTSTDGLTTTRIDMNNAEIFYSDTQGELKIAMVDGKKVLTAKDPQGRLLFSGPVETPEEVQKLPAAVKVRFEKLKTHELPAAIPAPPAPPAPPMNGADRETAWRTTSVDGCKMQRVSLPSQSIVRLMPAQKLML